MTAIESMIVMVAVVVIMLLDQRMVVVQGIAVAVPDVPSSVVLVKVHQGEADPLQFAAENRAKPLIVLLNRVVNLQFRIMERQMLLQGSSVVPLCSLCRVCSAGFHVCRAAHAAS